MVQIIDVKRGENANLVNLGEGLLQGHCSFTLQTDATPPPESGPLPQPPAGLLLPWTRTEKESYSQLDFFSYGTFKRSNVAEAKSSASAVNNRGNVYI